MITTYERSPTARIGLIGVGTVGGALRAYFEERGERIACFDKYKDAGALDDVNEAEIVFICVPTPYREGRGLDTDAVDEAVSLLTGEKLVVLKSTSPPGTTARLQAAYPQHRFFFNPEFLRERSAALDFIQPDRQLVGYCGGDRDAAHQVMSLLPRAPYEAIVSATTAELIKLLTNSFLALRVIFANQVYEIASRAGVDYEEVRAGLAADIRIGDSHFDVFDGGYRGYGGKCLPKDVGGIIDFARGVSTPLPLLEMVHHLNRVLTGADESVVEQLILPV